MPSPLDQREAAGGSGSSCEGTTEPHGLRQARPIAGEVAHPAAHSVLSGGLGSSSSSHHSAAMDSAATFRVTSEYSPRNESTSQCESSGIAMPVGMALSNHPGAPKTGHPLRRDGWQLPLSASRSRSVSHPQRIINEVFLTPVPDEPSAPVLNPVQALKNCRLGTSSTWASEFTKSGNAPPESSTQIQTGSSPRGPGSKAQGSQRHFTSPGAKVHIAEPL